MVRLVDDEGNVCLACDGREFGQQGWRVDGARLCHTKIKADEEHIWARTGLFGVTKAIALVRGVISALHFSGDGRKPSSARAFSGTGLIPNIVSVILQSHKAMQTKEKELD